MTRLEFLRLRVAFTGLPAGVVRRAAARLDSQRWRTAFLDNARQMRALAQAAERDGRLVTAIEAWRWAAAAYHAATIGLHSDRGPTRCHGIGHCRRLSTLAYRRAVALEAGTSAVLVPCAGGDLHGYLRLPPGAVGGVVVVVNGLDSVCEVELHAFGDRFLSRGLAVLALDLPADFAGRPRAPRFETEHVAVAVAGWVARHEAVAGAPLAAFGVSFGGHLAARFLAGDPRFMGAVAVSAPADLDADALPPRIRSMLALAFAVEHADDVAALATRITIRDAPPPQGRLLLLHMRGDELFGESHVLALERWAGNRSARWTFDAEHVGTSQMHRWLPRVADWLTTVLSGKEIPEC